MNTVTYTLANGAKIMQPINKQAFVDEKGRNRTEAEMHKLFADTAWDKGAVKYTIDSETNESVVKEKELHFTKNARKVAKRDYKDFKRSNSLGFKHSLRVFQRQFVDAFVNNQKRSRFNIGKVILQ
jgi:hypothetical protein